MPTWSVVLSKPLCMSHCQATPYVSLSVLPLFQKAIEDHIRAKKQKGTLIDKIT